MARDNIPRIRSLTLRLLSFGLPYKHVFALVISSVVLVSLFDRGRAFLAKFLIDDILPLWGESTAGPATVEFTPAVQMTLGFLGIEPTLWSLLLLLCAAAGVAALALGVFGFIRLYATEYLANRIVVDLRHGIYSHLLKLHMGFFDVGRVGELMSRTTADVQVTHRALRHIFGEVPYYSTLLLFSVVLMFAISWQLALVVAVFASLLLILLARFGRQILRSARRKQGTIAAVMDNLQQTLAGIRIVKAFGTERQEEESFRERLGTFFKHSMRVSKARIASRTTLEFVTSVSIPLFLLLGSWIVIENVFPDLSAGDFIAFTLVLMMSYMPMKALVKAYNVLQESLAGGERVFEILDRASELEDAPDAVALPKVKDGVAYRNISFSYDGSDSGRWVLEDVTFEIKGGEMVALVGETGSGKSTLVDLLFRFYDPNQGSIEIDGLDLRKIRRASLLEHLAVVTQDPFLFNASVRDNIRYGKKDATDEEIERAGKLAQIHDLITSLPDGYDTVVGERGTVLSGGERQRVTIARAILRDADILVLDEATSSLDSKVEKEVQAGLDNLMRNRTTLVIAHRLSTIVGADRIVVLQDGHVAEVGKHNDLMEKDGVYKRLFEIQRAGLDTETGGSGKAPNGKDTA